MFKKLESTLINYKHTMELIRTLIGLIVLFIQFMIIFKL